MRSAGTHEQIAEDVRYINSLNIFPKNKSNYTLNLQALVCPKGKIPNTMIDNNLKYNKSAFRLKVHEEESGIQRTGGVATNKQEFPIKISKVAESSYTPHSELL